MILMRIMSINLLCAGKGERRWENRAEKVAKIVKKVNPDSFGVQEAHYEWMCALRELLPEYESVGVGRDDGKNEGEFSAVFFKRDKFDAVENETFWISETPELPSRSWNTACIRVCTWVKLVSKESSETFIHLNTHLDHVSELARMKGVELIKKKVAEFKDIPVVCTGDYNFEQGCDCYIEMVNGELGDARMLTENSDSTFTFHWFKPEEIQSIIDFVFVKRSAVEVENFKVVAEKVDGDFYSDHYAVYADINII